MFDTATQYSPSVKLSISVPAKIDLLIMINVKLYSSITSLLIFSAKSVVLKNALKLSNVKSESLLKSKLYFTCSFAETINSSVAKLFLKLTLNLNPGK